MKLEQTLLTYLAADAAAAQSMNLTEALGSQNSSLSSLSSLLSRDPGLLSTLNSLRNVTILAPDNDALSMAMGDSSLSSTFMNSSAVSALLMYHVLNGTYYASNITNTSAFIPTALNDTAYTNVTGGQRVEARLYNNNVTFFSALKQNASVVMPDMNFTGGTIHIINGLLSIPGNDTATLSNANLTAAAGAIRSANLSQALEGMSNVTIFAPNNPAFDAIGSAVGNLTAMQLGNIISYHVVNDTVAYSDMLTNGTNLTAADGRDIRITNINGTLFANAAKITVPDILVENGVIHVVDQVLNPDNTSATPNATATTASPGFPGASTGTDGIPFTSGVATPTTTYPAATSGGGATETSASSSEGLAALPLKTGVAGAAALFGGAALLVKSVASWGDISRVFGGKENED